MLGWLWAGESGKSFGGGDLVAVLHKGLGRVL